MAEREIKALRKQIAETRALIAEDNRRIAEEQQQSRLEELFGQVSVGVRGDFRGRPS
jgi:hypothetical protein